MPAGRPPKPTTLKLVEGNRGKRALNKQEPDPDYLQDMTAPDWLPADAKTVWDDLAPKLRRARVLTEIDVPMVCMLCISIAQYRQASKLADRRLLVKGRDDSGMPSINPALIIQSMSAKQAMAVMREFGMSPSARTRIMVQPQSDLFADHGASKAASYFG
jgi:P27 family predicted phage terminase small subunit